MKRKNLFYASTFTVGIGFGCMLPIHPSPVWSLVGFCLIGVGAIVGVLSV